MSPQLSEDGKSAGWSVLARQALELGFIALASWATRCDDAPVQIEHLPAVPTPAPLMVEAQITPAEALMPSEAVEPREFLVAISDAGARFFRAHDANGEMQVAFYSDGRIRMADERHRFAGMVQNGHAHVLLVGTEDWSEVYVRTTAAGEQQLEVRGGPLDGRVLTCEPVANAG